MTGVRVLPDPEAVARHAADALAWRIADAARAGREFHLALAGGSSPRRAYERLGAMEGAWEHVHVWLVDERCVPADDERANARMIRESLLAKARASPPVLHDLQSRNQPEDAAWLYGLELHAHVPDLVLDAVVLGAGPDGHVASLFEGHPQLDCEHAPCVAVRDSPKPPPERVTLTLPLLRRARYTLLVITGADKAQAARRARDHDASAPVGRLGAGLDEIVCDTAAADDS